MVKLSKYLPLASRYKLNVTLFHRNSCFCVGFYFFKYVYKIYNILNKVIITFYEHSRNVYNIVVLIHSVPYV